MKIKNKKIILLIISIFLFIFSIFISLFLGAENISPSAIFGNGEQFEILILTNLRLPRTLLALITGLLLGGTGAVFQLFFRNPLAEPGIIGISSGATLGAVIAGIIAPSLISILQNSSIIFFKLISPVSLFAFLGALLSGLFVTTLSFSKKGKESSIMLLLCGTALGTLYSSLTSIILLSKEKELHSIYTWILGSFNARGWNELLFILPCAIISILLMFFISRPLDILSCGETTAKGLGVEINKLRVLVLICASLGVSACVCAGGTIGFVGLIAPHIVRKLFGPKAKTLIPFSMIFGSTLLLLADTLARTLISPGELPTGVITSILGVPFFIFLCIGKKDS